ncbi:MAG: Cell wall hydrolyses involved in spore germination [Oceanicaulis sp. HLUCCA04]|nr:MAG: Cell wall hydrolyses involved in spore germination [Oceanicaulis sp. HLUCCA04]
MAFATRMRSALSGFARLSGVAAALGMMSALPLLSGELSVRADNAHWASIAERYIDSTLEGSWEEGEALFQTASFTIDAPEGDFVPEVSGRSLDDLQTFDLGHLSLARDARRQQNCLAEAVYYEARGENLSGQMAVAEVVLNRVRHRAYPDDICGVVYQGSERATGCQFSFACDGSTGRAPRGRAWRQSQLVAKHAMLGFAPQVTRSATHFHTASVNPRWSSSLVQTRRIGYHIFYRIPNRAERDLLGDRGV